VSPVFVRNINFSLLFVLGILSCSSSANLNSKDAVRKAVMDHLSQRKGLDLNMNAMELDIGDVAFRANDADATVSFRPKGSQTAAMTMTYSLVRDGSQWKVKPKAAGEGGANPHGTVAPPAPAGAALPPGHPPVGQKK